MGSSEPTTSQIPTLTPQQQGLQNRVIDQLHNQFSNLPNEAVNLYENPLYQGSRDILLDTLKPKTEADLSRQFDEQIGTRAMQQFTRATLPNVQSQFAQLGAGRSSALNQAMAAAGQDLATDLASQRQQYLQSQRQFQLQAGQAAQSAATLPLAQQMQLFGPAMASATTPMVQGSQPGALSQALSFAGPIAAQYALGKGLGAAAGTAAGTALGTGTGTAAGTALGFLGGPVGGLIGGALLGSLLK